MRLLDLIFPQGYKCVICGIETEGISICDKCYEKLPLISGNKVCEICGGKTIGDGDVCLECKNSEIHYTKCFCVMDYVDEYAKLVYSYKNSNKKYLRHLFSKLLLDKFKSLDIPFDIILPMPIHDIRRKERGYNQVELMLDDIKNYYGRIDSNVLVKSKYTEHQTGLNKENRMLNLENSFKVVDKSKIKNKIVLVIDDIYTTGSTLNECAKTLFKAGAVKVYGLVLARGIIDIKDILDGDNEK